jgi:alkylhydroperoxidase/carboxymuconolactone decarboxylase family protein YurZ
MVDWKSRPDARPVALPQESDQMTVSSGPIHEALRRLALNDERFLDVVLTGHGLEAEVDAREPGVGIIDDHTRRLVRLAALIAVGGGGVSIDAAVSAAFGAGASEEEIVEVLLAIGPEVGAGRIVGAAPHVAAAIDYDMEADLEEL